MSQIQLCFTIHDQKAETFIAPFFVPAKGLAVRAFEDCINSETHHFGQHPADYTLFQIGSFDTDTGEFLIQEKTSMGNGVEFINPLKPEFPNGSPNPPILPDKNGGHSA